MKRLLTYGGSFNPLGLHQKNIIKRLLGLKNFDKILVNICGRRDDGKDTVNDIDPVHRASMLDLGLRDIPKNRFEVVLDDLENDRFLRTIDMEKKYEKEGWEVWYAIGYDLLKGFAEGKAEIQRWKSWKKLFYQSRFVVIKRAGYEFDPADLPPEHILIEPEVSGSSTEIRTLIFNHQPFEHLVQREVAEYINRFRLYQGYGSGKIGEMIINEWQAEIFYDRQNKASLALAGLFKENVLPELIISLGGDGTLLEVNRNNWRRRLPVIGFNTGHKGHLLNDAERIPDLPAKFVVYNLPMLKVWARLINGQEVSYYAFNEVRTRNSTNRKLGKLEGANQEITVNGSVPIFIPFDGSDGTAVSTPQGSHGWTKGMGAPVLSIDSDDLILVRDNPYTGTWKGGAIPLDSEVVIKNLDPDKRPLNLFADSWWLGEVILVKIKRSRIANVQLAFEPSQTLPLKYALENFR